MVIEEPLGETSLICVVGTAFSMAGSEARSGGFGFVSMAGAAGEMDEVEYAFYGGSGVL